MVLAPMLSLELDLLVMRMLLRKYPQKSKLVHAVKIDGASRVFVNLQAAMSKVDDVDGADPSASGSASARPRGKRLRPSKTERSPDQATADPSDPIEEE